MKIPNFGRYQSEIATYLSTRTPKAFSVGLNPFRNMDWIRRGSSGVAVSVLTVMGFLAVAAVGVPSVYADPILEYRYIDLSTDAERADPNPVPSPSGPPPAPGKQPPATGILFIDPASPTVVLPGSVFDPDGSGPLSAVPFHLPPPPSDTDFGPQIVSYVDGHPVVGYDNGTETDPALDDNLYWGFFPNLISPAPGSQASFFIPDENPYDQHELHSHGDWVLKTPTGVPDTGSSLMFLALSLLGLRLVKRAHRSALSTP